MGVIVWVLVALATTGALALIGLLGAHLIRMGRDTLSRRRRTCYLNDLFTEHRHVVYRPSRAPVELSTTAVVREANARGYQIVAAVAGPDGCPMLMFERSN